MKTNFFVFVFIISAAILVSACSGKPAIPAPSAIEQPTATMKAPDDLIGISLPDKSSERWISDGNNLVKIFTEMGYRTELQFTENEYGTSTQVAQIEEMVNKGVNVLIIAVAGRDHEGGYYLKDILKKAQQKGVLVMAYEREMVHNMPYIDYYVAYNNFQVGVIQGTQIETALGLKNGKGPFNIELFGGHDPCIDSYYDGAMSVLEPYIHSGKLVVQSGQKICNEISIVDYDEGDARVRMAQLLKVYYTDKRVNAILSPKDSISRGIISSLKSAGYGTADLPWPVVTGQDADLTSIKKMIAGEQMFTVFEDHRKLVFQAAAMVDAALRGQTVPTNDAQTYTVNSGQPYSLCLKMAGGATVSCTDYSGERHVPSYLLTPVNIDINNYKQVLIDGGYYTADQIK